MGMSAIAPVMAPVTPLNPVLAFTGGCAEPIPIGMVCVAPDRDRDGTCDGTSFLMSILGAQRAGVNGACS